MTIPFLQAKFFRRGPRANVDLVVIHTAEIGESAGAAEALMKRCAVTDRVASWHYAVDRDSITQSVREEDVAFHAPGANNNGVGIELCADSSQSAAEWDDEVSRKTLGLAAGLAADICARWGIPAQLVDVQGLLDGKRGITTHAHVSAAFKKSSHTDPGGAFPMSAFLEMVRAGLSGVVPPARPSDPGVVRPRLVRGAKGTAVAELQRLLNGAGATPALRVDGDFGEKTQTALLRLQVARGLAQTGVADASSWASLLEIPV
jgi:N-acetyl-anhydromuramyl-L-alanine amidase AmpD